VPALEREHYRSRFVAAATRSGELLVGRGDDDQAERVARRAVEVDPWAENAYAVLVSVALARGDGQPAGSPTWGTTATPTSSIFAAASKSALTPNNAIAG
jgi:hypothetical protein